MFEAHISLIESYIPSVNMHSKPGVRKNGIPYLYKPSSVEKYQKELICLCQKTDLHNIKQYHVETAHIEFHFIFHKRFFRRDCSNMTKSTEDALVSVIEVDDSRFLKVISEKHYQPDKKKPEEIHIIVSLLDFSLKMEKVHL